MLNSDKVFVYWNLHKKCWSVKHVKTNKVVKHLDTLVLTDCTFKVSEAGRQRVLREKQKNVHAGVIGCIINIEPKQTNDLVYYNPYKQSTFTCNGEPILTANIVSFLLDKQVFINIF